MCISEGVVAIGFNYGGFDTFRLDEVAGVTMKEVSCAGVIVWDVTYYFAPNTDDELTGTRTIRCATREEAIENYLKATNALKVGEPKKTIVIGGDGRLGEKSRQEEVKATCECEIPWWMAIAIVNLVPMALAYAYFG
jgi:hypothetical protein